MWVSREKSWEKPRRAAIPRPYGGPGGRLEMAQNGPFKTGGTIASFVRAERLRRRRGGGNFRHST